MPWKGSRTYMDYDIKKRTNPFVHMRKIADKYLCANKYKYVSYKHLEQPDSNNQCRSEFQLCNGANPSNSVCVPKYQNHQEHQDCPVTDLRIVTNTTRSSMLDQ